MRCNNSKGNGNGKSSTVPIVFSNHYSKTKDLSRFKSALLLLWMAFIIGQMMLTNLKFDLSKLEHSSNNTNQLQHRAISKPTTTYSSARSVGHEGLLAKPQQELKHQHDDDIVVGGSFGVGWWWRWLVGAGRRRSMVLLAEAGKKKKKEKSEVVVISVNSPQGKGHGYGGGMFPIYVPSCGASMGHGGYGRRRKRAIAADAVDSSSNQPKPPGQRRVIKTTGMHQQW